jgi:hypothetical protein
MPVKATVVVDKGCGGGGRPNPHFYSRSRVRTWQVILDLLTSEAHQSRVHQSRKAEIRRPKLNHNS